MEFSFLEIALLLVAGFVAGIVNTLAGSGTLFTFGAMLLVGIPINLANTTNRVGVLFQNISGVASYTKFGAYSWKDLKLIHALPTLAGAMVGALLAVEASESLLNVVAATVMALLGIDLVFDLKKKWFGTATGAVKSPWLISALLFGAGVYGGFIQIGIGILLIAVLYRFISPSLQSANYLKLLLILIYTVPTTLYFIYKGQIIWVPAILLAIGQVFGAYLAGFYSNVSPRAELVIKRLLVVMIAATLIKIIATW